jgi:hypothetical protein
MRNPCLSIAVLFNRRVKARRMVALAAAHSSWILHHDSMPLCGHMCICKISSALALKVHPTITKTEREKGESMEIGPYPPRLYCYIRSGGAHSRSDSKQMTYVHPPSNVSRRLHMNSSIHTVLLCLSCKCGCLVVLFSSALN